MNISPQPRAVPQLANGYAEPKEAAAKVALFDDFDGENLGTEINFPHGQAVESILLSHSELKDQDVQRVQNAPPSTDINQLMQEKHLPFDQAFRAMVARNIAKFYLTTTINVRNILNENPTVKVISQSQGETSARQVEQLFPNLANNPKTLSTVAQHFQLPAEASLKEVCQALLNEADRISSSNEVCQKARQEFVKAAKEAQDRGVTYLVAAGNHGDFGRELESIGVEASASAFRNVLVNDHVTVVGATDAQGNPSTLNSPNARIEVYALGENLPWHVGEDLNRDGVNSGTSFATPIVAGKAAQIYQHQPSVTPFDVKSQLMGEESYSVHVGQQAKSQNGFILEGDGKLEPEIMRQIGEGFITSLDSEDALQLARASQDNVLFGLPGSQDHLFQIVKVNPNSEGVRELNLETYFLEGYHSMRATAKDGKWDLASAVEELHLDPERQKQIESQPSKVQP